MGRSKGGRFYIEISSELHPLVQDSGKNLAGDQWDIPEGSLVGTVLENLGLSQIPTMLILNQRMVTGNTYLKEGDRLRIFPLVGGG